MSRYAKNTTVPVERSKGEIERTLARYGASKFGYMTELGAAVVLFEVEGRGIKMVLKLPFPGDFAQDRRGRKRTAKAIDVDFSRAVKQRWRALALVVKAKLEAIDSGIATFDDEWLAYMVLPGGRTVGEAIAPQLEQNVTHLLLTTAAGAP